MTQPQTLTTSLRKSIASLRNSRQRRQAGLFVIEGTRAVLDTAAWFDVEHLVATHAWLDEHRHMLTPGLPAPIVAKNDEIARMSSLTTPQGVMAVCRMPQHPDEPTEIGKDELLLALDKVQDPGNLGTIMRIADWMGITRILASTDTVDLYNPKAIQASMGAIARVSIIYTDLPATLRRLSRSAEVYGTFLDGDNIYHTPLTTGGIIVMGNEGNGISPETAEEVTRRIRIPSYPEGRPTVESLNVSMATAITLAEFRRRANS